MKLKALASQLGLSITTVSRALNGYSDVSDKTRDRVRAAADHYGYTPNVSAQQLITGRARAIGFVMPVSSKSFADPFLLELLTGLGETLRLHEHDLVVSTAEPGREEIETYSRLVLGRRVDGLVVVRTRVDDERIGFLRTHRAPFVTHGQWQGQIDFDVLECDNSVGGRLAAECLTNIGHRKLLFVNAPRQFNFAAKREAAVLSAAKSANAEIEIVEAADIVEEECEKLLLPILARPSRRPTGVICANDRLAVGAMRAARSAGLRIGIDVSIVGYDDVPFSRFTEPPLTTVRQPIRQAGRRLAQILINRIEDASSPLVSELWKPELIARATHGVPLKTL